MNIDLLHFSVSPIVGGVEAVIGYHARMMSRAGHTVRLLAGRGEQVDNGIPFVSIPLADSRHSQVLKIKSDLDKGLVPPEFDPVVAELEDVFTGLERETDLLIAHNVCSLNKNLALTAALHRLFMRGQLPHLILWHHDLAWCTPRYRAELHQGYPWNLLRTSWPGVTQVVVSKARQAELAELTGIAAQNIHVIPNGIDVAQFMKFDPFTQRILEKGALLQARPIFLLPVRLTPRKNIELALRIIQALQAAYPRVRLVVSGPPGPHNPANVEYFDKLCALRSELQLDQAVVFLAELNSEYIPERVISDLYQLADALLLTSLEEGFGIPILEAGVSGMPIFCSSIPSLQELGGKSVTYFSLEDTPAVIASRISTELELNKIAGFKMMVKENYTWDHIYQKYISPLLLT